MTDKPTPEALRAAVALRERIASLREPFDPDEETASDFDTFACEARAKRLIEEANERREDDAVREAEIQRARKAGYAAAVAKLREPSIELTTTIRDAQYYFIIDNNSEWQHDRRTEATVWWVIDTRTADPDVNWRGDLIAECSSVEEARRELGKAIARAAADALEREAVRGVKGGREAP